MLFHAREEITSRANRMCPSEMDLARIIFRRGVPGFANRGFPYADLPAWPNQALPLIRFFRDLLGQGALRPGPQGSRWPGFSGLIG